jgi:hypothetical protein
LQLDVISPSYSEIQADRVGDIGRIQISTEFGNAIYTPKNVKGRPRYRFGNDMEIWPIFTFNPRRGSRNFYGVPIPKPLYYDIEQYINSGNHNRSLLKNGARPGGSFVQTSDIPLTDKQFARMQDQIDKYYVGSGNAGRPLLMEGGVNYQEHITTNRDMDYKSLVENARNAIYRQLNIPLPLIETKTMTYGNYETAQVALYDRAVLPMLETLLNQLTVALMYKYEDDWKRYRLGYDPTEIPALQLKRTESIKTKKLVGVHTVNELRNDFGDEPVDGGDVILRPANEIPALEDEEPPPTSGEPADKEDTEKALRAATNADGSPKYSEKQIGEIMGRLNGDQ